MKRILVCAFIILAAVGAFAATTATHPINLNVVAICSIELDPDSSSFTLSPQAPILAGNPPDNNTNTSKHLWYTVVRTNATSSKITVAWGGADAAPAGCSLTVQATNMGAFGTAEPTVTFVNNSAAAQDFITAIPSCATTRVANAGPQLNYTLVVVTPASLVVGDDHAVNILYTISAT